MATAFLRFSRLRAGLNEPDGAIKAALGRATLLFARILTGPRTTWIVRLPGAGLGLPPLQIGLERAGEPLLARRSGFVFRSVLLLLLHRRATIAPSPPFVTPPADLGRLRGFLAYGSVAPTWIPGCFRVAAVAPFAHVAQG